MNTVKPTYLVEAEERTGEFTGDFAGKSVGYSCLFKADILCSAGMSCGTRPQERFLLPHPLHNTHTALLCVWAASHLSKAALHRMYTFANHKKPSVFRCIPLLSASYG